MVSPTLGCPRYAGHTSPCSLQVGKQDLSLSSLDSQLLSAPSLPGVHVSLVKHKGQYLIFGGHSLDFVNF